MQRAKPSVFPAKAGIHKPVAGADSLWIPAFAGTTEGLTKAPPIFESHPIDAWIAVKRSSNAKMLGYLILH